MVETSYRNQMVETRWSKYISVYRRSDLGPGQIMETHQRKPKILFLTYCLHKLISLLL